MLTLQFIPYEEISDLESEKKIQKLLRIVKQEKIVLMEGRLKTEEETQLIESTMNLISKKFKGIEVSTIDPRDKNSKNNDLQNKLKRSLFNLLLGRRRGLTIIGPANIIKEIKKDPNRILLYTTNIKKR